MTPMQLGSAAETQILGLAVTVGVFMGVIYDLFKIIRHTVKLKAVRFICDFIYALMFGAVFFVFSLAQTNYIRGFALLGMIAGAAMWSFTAGRLCVFIICAFLDFISGKIVVPILAFINKTAGRIGRSFVKNCTNFEK